MGFLEPTYTTCMKCGCQIANGCEIRNICMDCDKPAWEKGKEENMHKRCLRCGAENRTGGGYCEECLGKAPMLSSLPDAQEKPLKEAEKIDHPQHYGGDTVYEAIKVIEAWQLGFNLGNAVKYVCRAGKKGDVIDDLKKARWYLDRAIKNVEEHGQCL